MRLPEPIARVTQRVESLTIVVILVVAGALWAFIGLADEMIEGDLHAFDEAILMALRAPGDAADPIGGPQIETAMRDLTALGGITVLTLLTLSATAFLLLRGKRASAAFLLVAVVGGQLLSHGFKSLFSRPRPDLVPHGVDVATASFPSGHSMMAAVTYLTLAVMLSRMDGRVRIRVFFVSLAAVLACAVGISRVYLGVHWPSDVLAGWTLGAAWALFVWLVARWLERRGRIDREAADRPG
jgi:undecaprenyl-diphosphatase